MALEMWRFIALSVLVFTTGCGSSEQDRAGEVVKSYVIGAAERDAARVCDALAPTQLVGGQSCEKLLDGEWAAEEPLDDQAVQQAKRVEITWVEIAGDRAKVGTDAASEPFLLIKTDDRWYIDPAGESSAETADKGTSDAIADRKIATASMLKVEDFPKGWSAEPRDRTDDAMCTITEATERTGAQSPWLGFNRGERESLSHRVYVFPDEAVADSAFAVFSEIRSLTCAADEFKATRAKEQGVEVVDVETLSEPGPAIGDASAANHMTMVLRQDGQTTSLKMHLLLVRQARGIGVILLQSQRPVDPALRDRLLRAISKRLATHTA